MTKEIKATAPTREELYQEYKRVREENERLRKRLELAEACLDGVGAEVYYQEITTGEQNK